MADKLLDIKVEDTRSSIGCAMPGAISCDLPSVKVKLEDDVVLGDDGIIDMEIGLNGIKMGNVDAAPEDVETSGGQSVNTSVSIKKEGLGICYDLVKKVKVEKEEDGTNDAVSPHESCTKGKSPPKKMGGNKKVTFVSPTSAKKTTPVIDGDEIVLLSTHPLDWDTDENAACNLPGSRQGQPEHTATKSSQLVPEESHSALLSSTTPETAADNESAPDQRQVREERARNRKRKRDTAAVGTAEKNTRVPLPASIEYQFQPDGRGIMLAANGPSILFELREWNFCLNQGCPLATLMRADLGNPGQIVTEYEGFRKVHYERENFSVYVVPVTLSEYAECPEGLQNVLLQVFKEAEKDERLIYCRFVKVKVQPGPSDAFQLKLVNEEALVIEPLESIELIEPRLLYRFLRQQKIVNVEAVWVSEQEPAPCNSLSVTEATVGVFVAAFWPDIFVNNVVTVGSYKAARGNEIIVYTMQATLNSMTAWGIDKAKKRPRDYIRSVPTKRTVLSWLDPTFLDAVIPMLQRPHLFPLTSVINQPMLQSLRPLDLEKSTLPENCPPLDTRDEQRTILIKRFKIFQLLRRSGLLRIELA